MSLEQNLPSEGQNDSGQTPSRLLDEVELVPARQGQAPGSGGDNSGTGGQQEGPAPSADLIGQGTLPDLVIAGGDTTGATARRKPGKPVELGPKPREVEAGPRPREVEAGP